MHPAFRLSTLATIAALAGFTVAVPLVPATAQQAATLTLEVRWKYGSSTYPLVQAFACVGAGTNQVLYGTKPTDVNGRAVFEGVPLGVPVYVTADKQGKATPYGPVQGTRINYVAKSSAVTLVLEVPVNNLDGPSCATPIGQEPIVPPQKDLPELQWVLPVLSAPLKATGGTVATTPYIKLYTHSDASGLYLLVEGPPSTYQVAVDEQIDGYTTRKSAQAGFGRMPAIDVKLPPGDGLKTIYLKLNNYKGNSPVYTVQQQFVDMMTPCAYSTRRVLEWGGSDIDAEGTLGRGLTRTFGGDGTNLQYFHNKGPHRMEFSFRSLDSNGHEQGSTIVQSLEPNKSSSSMYANLKSARCF